MYMKKFSSLLSGKCKLKTQVDATSHLLEWLLSKQWKIISLSRMWTNSPCWWECKLIQPLWKAVGRFLTKFKIRFSNSKGTETCICMRCQIPVFIAALFIIAKIQNQLKCHKHAWIKKMWYIHTMEYYLAMQEWNPVICINVDEPGGVTC
jgi:hypothetical protein